MGLPILAEGGNLQESERRGIMLFADFGIGIVFLIACSFYAFRHYPVINRVWLSVASCGALCAAFALSFVLAWIA